MINLPGKLALIGAGKMGTAMLQGWLASGVSATDVVIIDPAPPPETAELIAEHTIVHNPDLSTVDDIALIIVAIKPQMIAEVLPAVKGLAKQSPLVVSVVAGTKIATFQHHFGSNTPVVRTMPNTPAAVGRGITAMVASGEVTDDQRELARQLLQAIGKVVEINDEDLIDAVTAVSGSGPAYIFYLTECMTEAGKALGLPGDVAETLARETVAGAGELMHQSGISATTLRENVTSPNGTTYAALQVLMAEPGLSQLMKLAMAAAEHRSRELAG